MTQQQIITARYGLMLKTPQQLQNLIEYHSGDRDEYSQAIVSAARRMLRAKLNPGRPFA